MMNNYVYLETEPGLYTVGHHDPAGEWHSVSDHYTEEDAEEHVARLNGKQDKQVFIDTEKTAIICNPISRDISWYTCPRCLNSYITSMFTYCPICGVNIIWRTGAA